MILPRLEAHNHGAGVVECSSTTATTPCAEDQLEAAIKDCSKGNFVGDVRPPCLITRYWQRRTAIHLVFQEFSRLLPDL